MKKSIIVYCLLMVITCLGCNKQGDNAKNTNKDAVQLDHEIVKLYPIAKKVGKDYLWGYVDENGTMALDYKYKKATIFSEGRAFVWDGNGNRYIDKNGNESLNLKTINFKEGYHPNVGSEGDYIDVVFKNGRASIHLLNDNEGKELFAEIDYKGNVLSMSDYMDGKLVSGNTNSSNEITYDDKTNSIMHNGKVTGAPHLGSGSSDFVFTPKKVGAFVDGYATIKINNGTCNYIDEKGSLLSKQGFQECSNFSNKLAIVVNNDQYSLLNDSGVLKPISIKYDMYNKIIPASEGYAAIASEKKVTFIDSNGDVKFTLQHQGKTSDTSSISVGWDNLHSFHNGIALTAYETKNATMYSYVNKDGKVIAKFTIN